MTYRSPGGPPKRPAPPLFGTLIRWPPSTPAGIRTLTCRARRSVPLPLHVGHGTSICIPVPPQATHGWLKENIPWFSLITPCPPHTGQTVRRGAGCGPGPGAGRTNRVRRHVDGGSHTFCSIRKGKMKLGLEVDTALRPGRSGALPGAPAAPPENIAKQVAKVVHAEIRKASLPSGAPAPPNGLPAYPFSDRVRTSSYSLRLAWSPSTS